MATLTIPDETYGRLVSRAAKLRVTLEDLVVPLLEREPEASVPAPQLPLKGEARQKALENWHRMAEDLAKTLPPGFRVETDRDFFYPEFADPPE